MKGCMGRRKGVATVHHLCLAEKMIHTLMTVMIGDDWYCADIVVLGQKVHCITMTSIVHLFPLVFDVCVWCCCVLHVWGD